MLFNILKNSPAGIGRGIRGRMRRKKQHAHKDFLKTLNGTDFIPSGIVDHLSGRRCVFFTGQYKELHLPEQDDTLIFSHQL